MARRAAERLDYFPTQREAAPLLVFIHGGYWRSLDKSDFSWLAPPFIQHGVALALLNYGLAPATAIEDIVRQQLRALAWLYRNGDRLGFDPERIVVAGHSAGAHLTAMMMAALWPVYDRELPPLLVKGGLGISGIYDLAPLVHAPFVNVDLRLDERRADALSPVHLPPATSAPLITAVGGLESSEFRRQTTLDRPRVEEHIPARSTDAACQSLVGSRRTREPGVAAVRRSARTDPLEQAPALGSLHITADARVCAQCR